MTESALLAGILVSAAAFSIGLSKSGLAGALGPLATILMLAALPARTAVGVQLPLLIAGDIIAITLLWRRWDSKIVVSTLPGVVVGVVLGTVLLDVIPADALARVIGVIAVGFGIWQLVIDIRRSALEQELGEPGRLAPFAAGAAAGTSSAIAHAGGPPMTMYLLSRRLDPKTFVATSAAVFAVVNLLKVPFYAWTGVFDWHAQLQYAWAFAFIPLGAVLGRVLLSRIPRKAFRLIVTIGLLVGGIVLILR